MDSNPFAQLAKKSKCEAPVELHNVAQAVFKITMDMEDQKEVVVLPNLMGKGSKIGREMPLRNVNNFDGQ